MITNVCYTFLNTLLRIQLTLSLLQEPGWKVSSYSELFVALKKVTTSLWNFNLDSWQQGTESAKPKISFRNYQIKKVEFEESRAVDSKEGSADYYSLYPPPILEFGCSFQKRTKVQKVLPQIEKWKSKNGRP